jgi:ribosomal protein S18 acetylase RimI-like enzyme
MKIRKAVLSDVDGIAKVHVDCWKTTYAGIIPDVYINQITYEKRAELWERVIPNGNVFVAEDGHGGIIGFADGDRERTGNYEEYKGEMYSIYILKSYQGQGIGKRLIKEVAHSLVEQDIHSMLVWVLKDNPSCHFYEKMGGKVVDSVTVDFSGKELAELAYGWQDIRSLT